MPSIRSRLARRFQSLSWRITLPQVGLLFLVLTGLLVYLSAFIKDLYIDTLRLRLEAENRQLAVTAAGLFQDEDAAAVQRYVDSLSEALQTRITLIRGDGVVLADSETSSAEMENHLNRPEIQRALAAGAGFHIRMSATTGIETLYVAAPVPIGNAQTGFLRQAIPLSAIDQTVRRMQETLLAVMAAAFLLMLISSIQIVRSALQPVSDLTEAASRVAEGDLEPTLISAGKDEIGCLTDAFHTMTGRLRTQFQDLRAEQEKLAAVLEQMADGVVIVDAQDRISLINPAARTLFGSPRAEPAENTAAEVLRHYQLLDLLRQSRTTGALQSTTLETGLERNFLHALALPLGDALPGSILMLFQDLTRLRRLETVRRDFISNLSHELRTPLAALQALAETLQESALEDPQAARRFLDLMQTEIHTLHQMSSELLGLAQIESGQIVMDVQPVAPAAIVSEAVDRIRLQAERSGLRLNVAGAEAAALPKVAADSGPIEQVMANLLHIALKFTPPGGSIDISVTRSGNEAVFCVRDSGSGISAEFLPRIFERFYKTDRSRSGGGTGLGLAISRHIVEAHHGRIWAESALGEGSSFYFTLPFA